MVVTGCRAMVGARGLVKVCCMRRQPTTSLTAIGPRRAPKTGWERVSPVARPKFHRVTKSCVHDAHGVRLSVDVCWSNFPGHLDRWISLGRGR